MSVPGPQRLQTAACSTANRFRPCLSQRFPPAGFVLPTRYWRLWSHSLCLIAMHGGKYSPAYLHSLAAGSSSAEVSSLVFTVLWQCFCTWCVNFYDLLHVIHAVSCPVMVSVFQTQRNTNQSPGACISIKCPSSVSVINLSLCLLAI